MQAKEDTDQPSPSPQDKDGAEASNNDQHKPENVGGAKEQSASEGNASDVLSHPATAQDQPKSENFSSDKDKDEQEDEPEHVDGGGEMNTSGSDACPATTEDKPGSDRPDKGGSSDGALNEGDDNGAPNAAEVAMPEEEKEKERPVIVSNAATLCILLYIYMHV